MSETNCVLRQEDNDTLDGILRDVFPSVIKTITYRKQCSIDLLGLVWCVYRWSIDCALMESTCHIKVVITLCMTRGVRAGKFDVSLYVFSIILTILFHLSVLLVCEKS